MATTSTPKHPARKTWTVADIDLFDLPKRPAASEQKKNGPRPGKKNGPRRGR